MGKEQDLLDAARLGNHSQVLKLLAYVEPKKKRANSLAARLSRLHKSRKTFDINCTTRNGETALHVAAVNRHGGIVDMLLLKGADVNAVDSRGYTPLHMATWSNAVNICESLIQAGASANKQSMNLESALHTAAQSGLDDIVKLLVESGAFVGALNDEHETAMDLAAKFGRRACVKRLLDATERAGDSMVRSVQHSPLHLAARHGHAGIVQDLLDAGVSVNLTTYPGSALHEAVTFGRRAVVELLLERGVDVGLRNHSRQTAVELLQEQSLGHSNSFIKMIRDFVSREQQQPQDEPEDGQQGDVANAVVLGEPASHSIHRPPNLANSPSSLEQHAAEPPPSILPNGLSSSPSTSPLVGRGPAEAPLGKPTFSQVKYMNGSLVLPASKPVAGNYHKMFLASSGESNHMFDRVNTVDRIPSHAPKHLALNVSASADCTRSKKPLDYEYSFMHEIPSPGPDGKRFELKSDSPSVSEKATSHTEAWVLSSSGEHGGMSPDDVVDYENINSPIYDIPAKGLIANRLSPVSDLADSGFASSTLKTEKDEDHSTSPPPIPPASTKPMIGGRGEITESYNSTRGRNSVHSVHSVTGNTVHRVYEAMEERNSGIYGNYDVSAEPVYGNADIVAMVTSSDSETSTMRSDVFSRRNEVAEPRSPSAMSHVSSNVSGGSGRELNTSTDQPRMSPPSVSGSSMGTVGRKAPIPQPRKRSLASQSSAPPAFTSSDKLKEFSMETSVTPENRSTPTSPVLDRSLSPVSHPIMTPSVVSAASVTPPVLGDYVTLNVNRSSVITRCSPPAGNPPSGLKNSARTSERPLIDLSSGDCNLSHTSRNELGKSSPSQPAGNRVHPSKREHGYVRMTSRENVSPAGMSSPTAEVVSEFERNWKEHTMLSPPPAPSTSSRFVYANVTVIPEAYEPMQPTQTQYANGETFSNPQDSSNNLMTSSNDLGAASSDLGATSSILHQSSQGQDRNNGEGRFSQSDPRHRLSGNHPLSPDYHGDFAMSPTRSPVRSASGKRSLPPPSPNTASRLILATFHLPKAKPRKKLHSRSATLEAPVDPKAFEGLQKGALVGGEARSRVYESLRVSGRGSSRGGTPRGSKRGSLVSSNGEAWAFDRLPPPMDSQMTQTGSSLQSNYEEWQQFQLWTAPSENEVGSNSRVMSVGDWLVQIGLTQYENTLIANGFDNIYFLGGKYMDEEDLETIGISDDYDQARLIREAAKLPVKGIVDVSLPAPSVAYWLQSLDLPFYIDTFYKRGYGDLDRLWDMWEVELVTALNVNLVGHRKRILASLGEHKPVRLPWQQNGPNGENQTCSVVVEPTDDSTIQTAFRPRTSSCSNVLGSDPSDTPIDERNASPTRAASCRMLSPSSQQPANESSALTYDTPYNSVTLPRVPSGNSAVAAAFLAHPESRGSGIRGCSHLNGDSATHSEATNLGNRSPKRSAGAGGRAGDLLSKSAICSNEADRNRTHDKNVCLSGLELREGSFFADSELRELWPHQPELLLHGCLHYNLHYLGTEHVPKLDGVESTKQVIADMKAKVTSRTPSVKLAVSYKGVKFIDTQSSKVISEHEISNIFCATQGEEMLTQLAYVTRDLLNKKLYCHVFAASTLDLAREVLLTLGAAFEVNYCTAVDDLEDLRMSTL